MCAVAKPKVAAALIGIHAHAGYNEIMNDVKKAIDEVLRLGLKTPLKELGFSKQSRTWTRTAPGQIQLLNVQANRYNTAASASFTVNLGVYFPEVAAELGKPMAERPGEADCHIRQRLGNVSGKGDFWWKLDRGVALDAVAKSLQEMVLSTGIAWLNSFMSMKVAADSADLAGTIWDRMAIQHLAGHDERILATMRADLLQSDRRRLAWKDPAAKYGFTREYLELLELTRDRFEASRKRS